MKSYTKVQSSTQSLIPLLVNQFMQLPYYRSPFCAEVCKTARWPLITASTITFALPGWQRIGHSKSFNIFYLSPKGKSNTGAEVNKSLSNWKCSLSSDNLNKLDISALSKVLLSWRNLSQLFFNSLLNLENFLLQWLLLALAILIWLLSSLNSLEYHP